MDGYRQTLLGRTLADALRDLEEERDALELTAFNRFLDDWSVQARALPQDMRLNHCVADLHLPQQQGQEQGGEQAVALRLKLRQRT
ncbi:hypothetical protein PF008_g26213 [Phytophthora fragariae]|uniref:Uncharacterized protein n=1 Tax=Phytophthora fragariae TaxID=53985 RepID=A0A6G0QIM7_9STRA|nr:hypothetical protein PF008_g26213 [Phytophthora fragariae]